MTLNGALRAVTLASFGALCLVVAAVGAVAVVAETANTWSSFFLMERAIRLATPVATGLFGVTVASALGFVFTTRV